jgi:hypothetical protein
MSIDFNEGGSYINITLNEGAYAPSPKSATLTLPPIYAVSQLSSESRRDLFAAAALHAYLLRGASIETAIAGAVTAADAIILGMQQVATVTSNIYKAP